MTQRDPQEWQEEIDSGLEYRQKYGLEESWSRLEAIFSSVTPEQQGDPAPNLFLSQGDALLSVLNVPVPRLVVKPLKPQSVVTAPVVESVDNLLMDQLGLQEQVERMTLSTFLWGRGFLKVGFDSEFGWNPKFDIGLGEPAGFSVTQFDRHGRRIEFNANPGMPWVQAVLPHDIVVPWGVYDIGDTPWIAHRVVRHVEDVRADVKYSGTRTLQPIMSMADFVKSYETYRKPYRIGQAENYYEQAGEEREFVELWEIWDRRTMRVLTIATGHKKFLRNDPNELLEDQLPFVGLSFSPRTRNFWCTPDAFHLLYHQAELTDISIQSTKQRRMSTLKVAYEEGAIDEDELDKAMSADVGVGVRIKAGKSVRDVLQPFNFTNNNQQLYQESEIIRRNSREVVGFSRNQIGEFEPGGRRTAREVMTVNESSGLRMDRRQSRLARAYEECIGKINSIVFRHWKTPRIVEIVGPDGLPKWVAAAGEQLKGDYSLKVQFSVGTRKSQEQLKQEAFQLFMMLSQDPRVDPVKLAQFLAASINDPSFSSIFAEGVLNGGTGNQGVSMGEDQARAQQAPAGDGFASPQGANFNPGQQTLDTGAY